MKFLKNHFYKHFLNTDIAFEYQGVAAKYANGISIIVNWWNIVHDPVIIKKHVVVFIKNSALENWKEYVHGVSARKEGQKCRIIGTSSEGLETFLDCT